MSQGDAEDPEGQGGADDSGDRGGGGDPEGHSGVESRGGGWSTRIVPRTNL